MDVLLVCLPRGKRVSHSIRLYWEKNNYFININNDRIRIQVGANPFLLLWCIEIKSKEKNKTKQKKQRTCLNQRTSKSI